MSVFLVITAQQLHAQSDALVPLPGDDSDVSSIERRLKQILLMGVVVDVSLEKLQTNAQVAVKVKYFFYLRKVLVRKACSLQFCLMSLRKKT